MSRGLTKPPLAEREPVTDTLHGVEISDPYRWLEDKGSRRTREWIEAQTQYSRSYFAAAHGRGKVRERIAELLSIPAIDSPLKVGNRYFFLKRDSHQEQPCICSRDRFDGPDQVLIDPSARGPFVSVSIVNVSADGSLLAYGVRQGGEDSQAVEIFDVDKRETLPDCLPKGFVRSLHFLRNVAYVYSHEPLNSKRPYYRAAFVHYLARAYPDATQRHASDRELFIAGESPKLRLIVFADSDSTRFAYMVLRSAGHNTCHSVFLQMLGKCGRPQTLLVDDFVHWLDLHITGDRLLICTDWNAPNRRILSTPFDEPDLDAARVVVPETAARIQQWAVADNKIFVNYVEDLASLTRIFDFSGRELEVLNYPEPGTSRLARSARESAEQFYTFQSFQLPPTMFAYPRRPFSVMSVLRPPEIQIDRSICESTDGTRVPFFVLSRKGLAQQEGPAILTGYGGNAIALTPQFSQMALFFIERGCRFVVANLRGGSEFGAEWHKAAQRGNRQRSFDDFVSVALWLCRKGLTSPARLGIVGGSNSGLLVCASITQRPDLFRAAVALGPLTDMLRYHRYGFAHFWAAEYGTADNPEDFASLYAYSPYHRIEDGNPYPAFLMVSGDSDTRCDSMHARKFLARLQAASSSDHPVLLDYTETRGHTPSLPLGFRTEALTDRISFLCNELGVAL